MFGFIRALGDSRTPLYFFIFTTILNIIFNYIFIKYYNLGVTGSALGTVIAILISVICCLICIKKYFPILHLKKEDWIYNKDFMKEHLNIAIPMSVHFAVLSLSIIIIQAICNSFGEKIIVGFTIALRIEQLAIQPLLAIGIAIGTYVAQNYGACKISRIKEGVKKAILLTFSTSIVLYIFILNWGEALVSSFLDKQDNFVVNIGSSYLNISMIFYFFLGTIFIYRNTLQSMGKPFYPLMSGFIDLAIRSFAALFLSSKMGYVGIYYAGPLAWIGSAVVVIVGYYLNVYKKSEKQINPDYDRGECDHLFIIY